MNPQQNPYQANPAPQPAMPGPLPQSAPQPMPQPAAPSMPPTQPMAQPMTQPLPTQQPVIAMPNNMNQPGAVIMPGAQPQQPQQPQTIASGQPQTPTHSTPDLPISTQTALQISELRDGLVIMKDGSFRAVIACQSINFDLMSESEREGVEYSYQNFINSLEFTTQILIRSQRVDITPYLDRLSEIRRNNDNMLLGVLMDDYINFIDALAAEANIMDKSFFIVIPYWTTKDAEKAIQQTKNFFQTFQRSKTPPVTRIDRAVYEKAVTDINNRVESVVSGLFQLGINSVRLNTKELAELYYNFNNPDTAIREPLVDFTQVATMYVRKGQKNA